MPAQGEKKPGKSSKKPSKVKNVYDFDADCDTNKEDVVMNVAGITFKIIYDHSTINTDNFYIADTQ